MISPVPLYADRPTRKERRPCPRGLEDDCPIPRELCWEAYAQAGTWQCERLLDDFEWFVFGEDDEAEQAGDLPAS